MTRYLFGKPRLVFHCFQKFKLTDTFQRHNEFTWCNLSPVYLRTYCNADPVKTFNLFEEGDIITPLPEKQLSSGLKLYVWQ